MIRWIYDPDRCAWLTPNGWVAFRDGHGLPPVTISWPKGSQWIGTTHDARYSQPTMMTVLARQFAIVAKSITEAAQSAAKQLKRAFNPADWYRPDSPTLLELPGGSTLTRPRRAATGLGSAADAVVIDEPWDVVP